jgi:hypothetical protein
MVGKSGMPSIASAGDALRRFTVSRGRCALFRLTYEDASKIKSRAVRSVGVDASALIPAPH